MGDVHGRIDLLDQMIPAVHADIQEKAPANDHIVVLGDIIDRGPGSREVVERLRTYEHSHVRLTVLLGNHEEIFRRILDGELELIEHWLAYGGAATLLSYGLDPEEFRFSEPEDQARMLEERIPTDHRVFFQSLPDLLMGGEYLFVHAGVRPRVPVSQQTPRDLRWIREPFLSYRRSHGFVVVHGHTVTPEIVTRSNRIGVDTGAYATGRLSAVGLQGSDRWFLQVSCEASS